LLGFLRSFRPHPAEPVRDAVHVRVDADVAAALEGKYQHEVRRLAADARQRQQLLHRARHFSTEGFDEHPAGRPNVPRLVSIEADGIDEALDRPDRQVRHGRWRARGLEEPRRCGSRGLVLRARGQQRADEDLKRIFLALFGNLFDRGQLETVNLARKRAHDRREMARPCVISLLNALAPHDHP